jgi:putative hydrolase
MYGIELLLGAEINILDGEGNLDMDENCMRMLDIRIAGIHSLCYSYGTVDENTHGMVNCTSNLFVDKCFRNISRNRTRVYAQSE